MTSRLGLGISKSFLYGVRRRSNVFQESYNTFNGIFGSDYQSEWREGSWSGGRQKTSTHLQAVEPKQTFKVIHCLSRINMRLYSETRRSTIEIYPHTNNDSTKSVVYWKFESMRKCANVLVRYPLKISFFLRHQYNGTVQQILFNCIYSKALVSFPLKVHKRENFLGSDIEIFTFP